MEFEKKLFYDNEGNLLTNGFDKEKNWIDDIIDMRLGADPITINEIQSGILQFDNVFIMKIPDGINYVPETDDSYPLLIGFCKKNESEESDIDVIIEPMALRGTNSVEEANHDIYEKNSNDDIKCGYFMLYQSNDVEIGCYAEFLDNSRINILNAVNIIRVGTYTVTFKLICGMEKMFILPAKELKEAIQELCSLFDEIMIIKTNEIIKPDPYSDKISDLSKVLIGKDKETLSRQGIHCKTSKTVIVADDWQIDVPAGYVYSTDPEETGHRQIVLGLDDGTMDIGCPFDGTVNFSTILAGIDQEEFPGVPLDSPIMQSAIEAATTYLTFSCPIVFQNENILISYYEEWSFKDDENEKELFRFSGSILDRCQ